ncbi:MAG: hypothetical protein WKF84_20320 [Pyrinomonadaceae bacterium]
MEPNQTTDETNHLFDLLSAEEVHADALSSGLRDYGAASKDALIRRTAQTFAPTPEGRLLERLPYILSEGNRSDLMTTFICNLHSSDPATRRASLQGLEKLKHAALVDFALLSLRDETDEVVHAACQILLPVAKRDARVREILEGVYAARKNNERFGLSANLLKANGVERDAPALQ